MIPGIKKILYATDLSKNSAYAFYYVVVSLVATVLARLGEDAMDECRNCPRNLLALSLLLVVTCLTTACVTGTPFQSYNPSDYSDIIMGKYHQHPVTVHGKLMLPKNAAGKVPAVIIMPGSGGVAPWMDGYFASALHRAGIATFRIDSFSGRGVVETGMDQGRVSVAASVMDGFNALRFLASQPTIDSSRIGITGFSRGGIVAMFTAEERLHQAVLPPELTFAAHLPFYPPCTTQWENPRLTVAPMLILLGASDDSAHATHCVEYAKRLGKLGGNVSTIVYPEAHHGWVSDVPLVRIDTQTFNDCKLRIRDDGVIVDVKSGADSRIGWQRFVQQLTESCGGRGATYGANPTARAKSLDDMVRFFKSAFGMP